MSERLITVSGQFVEHVARTQQEMSDYFDDASNVMSNRLETTANQLFSRMGERTGIVSSQLDEAANLIFERLRSSDRQCRPALYQAYHHHGWSY